MTNSFTFWGYLGGLDGKEFACNAGDPGSIPWRMVPYSSILAWRIPGTEGAWWALVHGGQKESDTTEQPNT